MAYRSILAGRRGLSNLHFFFRGQRLFETRKISSASKFNGMRNYSSRLGTNTSDITSESSIAYEPEFVGLFDDTTWTDINLNQSFISCEEIQNRQRNLLSLATKWLRQANRSSSFNKQSPLVLIASNPPQYQAHTNLPVDNCKQNTDFTYFTGLHSGNSDQLTSDCVLALFAENPEAEDFELRSCLFAPTKTQSERLWNGPDLINSSYHDKGYLLKITNDVRPLSELVEFINGLVCPNRRDVFLSRNGLQYRPELVTHLKYYMIGTQRNEKNSSSNPSEFSEKWSTALSKNVGRVNVRDACFIVDQLRARKSPSEARALTRIGRIGARALKNTIEWSRNQVQFDKSGPFFESHVAAKFEFEARLLGAKRIAFPSVCASGRRSTIIHYGRNDRIVNPSKDWILTDVGAEDVDGYCCDISRTWPISLEAGRTENFKLRLHLYEALHEVQQQLIKSIRVGETSLDDLQKLMLNELGKLLLSFDVFDSSVVSNNSSNIAALTRKICPHHVSHYIGLDIHDSPTLSRSKPLQPGMCFSIEPGLYFPVQSLQIKPEFRGIGLRIEDDILIDPETKILINLSADCPSL